MAEHLGVKSKHIAEAVKRADKAGFWDGYDDVSLHGCSAKWVLPSEITVDVPVTDNAVLTVETEGDES